MTWSECNYMIDTNVLSLLSPVQRGCKFLRRWCRIPTEVLYEARFLENAASLAAIEYPTTERVLAYLVEVMATVPTDDTKLIDLYKNRGNADPLVVACALDAREESTTMMIGSTWVIVSNDNAVRSKAVDFDLDVMWAKEFVAMLG